MPEAAAAFQHGHAGTVTMIDLKKAQIGATVVKTNKKPPVSGRL